MPRDEQSFITAIEDFPTFIDAVLGAKGIKRNAIVTLVRVRDWINT